MTRISAVRPEPALAATVRLLSARLERHRADLNRLNVYPVPDADTGDNLVAMIRSVLAELPGADVADAITTGALHGGRGSSGVIFGQALSGFATSLPDPCDGAGLATALLAAATAAREAVADPVEGTILTVADDAARAAHAAASGSIADVVLASAAEGRRSLHRTPDLLPALARAGVVDAGGFGYVLFLDALAETITGTADLPVELPTPWPSDGHTEGGHFEVTCLLAAGADQVATLRARWLALGDTVAVAGTDHTWRCHIHTDDVDAALAAAREAGEVSDVEVTQLP